MNPLIRTISLKSGPSRATSPLIINSGSVTVFVGPNHSGKSKVLQEIRESIPNAERTRFSKVLATLEFNPFAKIVHDRLEEEVRNLSQDYEENGVAHVRIEAPSSWQMPKTLFDEVLTRLGTVEGLRAQLNPLGYNMANRLCLLLNGNERLNLLNPTPREELRGSMVTLFGLLFQDDIKRKEVQRIIREAFGWYFVVDVTGRDHFRAAVSDVEPPSGIERSLDDAALSYFHNCEDLSTTSDGVRAFAGMIAAVIASEANVILIDEPEAFLHPALCTSLANELCRKARDTGRQLIVATHSAPFLMGCVQAAVDLNVVRLTYRKGQATSRIMEYRDLVPLMRKPLLRSIGVLNGIFFESVIVTEAASDRAFYEEVNNRCLTFQHSGGIPDCLFLNAQNWQTTKIIGPLRKLGIAAAAIVDMDIVCEVAPTGFQQLLEAAGIPDATRKGLGQMRGELRPLTKPDAKLLKKKGINALSGDARQSMEDFIEHLSKYGIFVVPRGELEGWLPNLPRPSLQKNEWLESTFEAMGEDAALESYLKPTSDDVWEFIMKVRSWLHDPNRRGIPD